MKRKGFMVQLLRIMMLFSLTGFAQNSHKGNKYSFVDVDGNRVEVTPKKEVYWVLHLPFVGTGNDFSDVKPFRYAITKAEYDELLVVLDKAIDSKKDQCKKEEMGCAILSFVGQKEMVFSLKGESKSVQVIQQRFKQLKEKYKDKWVMVETKLMYTYVDGSGNTYTLTNQFNKCRITYDPITPENSSSGMYSGGSPYEHRVLFEEYLVLGSLFETAFTSIDEHAVSRSKGTGLLTLEGSAGRSTLLKMESNVKKQMDENLKLLKLKYINLDTTLGTTVKGKIVERSFESKKGVMTDMKEYYFIPADQEIKERFLTNEYFIKLSKGKVAKDETKKWVDQEITINATFLWGLWDTDDNTRQSRTGDYVVIFGLQ